MLAARELGFNFNKYVDDEAVREVIVTPLGGAPAEGGAPVTMRFQMTHYNLFNSTRKRASVVFRDCADGNKYKCWAKGADTFMLSRERLRGGQDEQIRIANEQLSEYGSRGLRTLVFAERILSDAEWEAFAALHHAASKTADVKERAAMLEDAAALVENEMTCVVPLQLPAHLCSTLCATLCATHAASSHPVSLPPPAHRIIPHPTSSPPTSATATSVAQRSRTS